MAAKKEVDEKESDRGHAISGIVPDQIEIEVSDPAITDNFNEADFDHDFDDDFEEEIEGEYEMEDDQYGEDFQKEFGHLTEDSKEASDEEE